jgi:hypothetical protein
MVEPLIFNALSLHENFRRDKQKENGSESPREKKTNFERGFFVKMFTFVAGE